MERITAERTEQMKLYTDDFNERRNEIKAKIIENEPHVSVDVLMGQFERRHKDSEYIDPDLVDNKVLFLLAVLVECGGDWPPNKLQDVRRIVHGFISQSYGLMKNQQAAGELKKIFPPGEVIIDRLEQVLINKWQGIDV